jgi:hypothetical protein
LTSASVATQPLAYVTPDPTRPISSPPPPHPPLQDSGSVPTLNPPPQPQHSPPQHTAPPQQPSTGEGPPPGPSTGSGGPQGTGGPGTQMPGSGQGGAPSAPLPATPLDTRPPPIPPPPSPGEPPLRPPTPPSWAQPPKPPSVQAALDQMNELEKLIQQHNSSPPDPSNYGAVSAYNSEADIYNSWLGELQGQLDAGNVQYTPSTTANTAQVPSWTQPAPQQPAHPAPSNPSHSTPEQIDEIPLETNLRQIEEKFSQKAPQFGVNDPRGRAGFDKFDKALKDFVHNPSTLHIVGTYRGQPVILNVNPDSSLVVIQDTDGEFISGWKLTSDQLTNILERGKL